MGVRQPCFSLCLLSLLRLSCEADRFREDDQGDALLAVQQHGSIGPCVLSRYYFDDDDGVEQSIHGFQIALACILEVQPKLITAFRR